MAKIKTAVVVPTIRESCILDWLDRWSKELTGTHVFIMEDNPDKLFVLEKIGVEFDHYCWKDIDKELGDKSWIIPRRTDCVRSFGLYMAWKMGYDNIITMDDDCYPDDKDFVATHTKYLYETLYPLNWFQHSQTIRVRGVPDKIVSTHSVANMGLWSFVPDLDAKTQISFPELRVEKHNFNFFSPFNYFSPISGMNLSFRRESVPAAYFLLMGGEYEYDRFGDIWMGIFLKKICDHLGVYITGGNPYVRHERASNPTRNLEKEKTGYVVNNLLWREVEKMKIEGSNFKDCYFSLAGQLPEFSPYWRKLKGAMVVWANLF